MTLYLLLYWQGTGGGPAYPDPSYVLSGITYGPTGADYTGTLVPLENLSAGDLDDIAAAVWSRNDRTLTA